MSLTGLIRATLLPTDCISLPSGKLKTTMEPQFEGNADISAKSCTAHTNSHYCGGNKLGGGEGQQSAPELPGGKRGTQVCVCLTPPAVTISVEDI